MNNKYGFKHVNNINFKRIITSIKLTFKVLNFSIVPSFNISKIYLLNSNSFNQVILYELCFQSIYFSLKILSRVIHTLIQVLYEMWINWNLSLQFIKVTIY